MNSDLRFPDKADIEDFLSEYAPLNKDTFQEQGITQVVAKLAAERFANRYKSMESFEAQVQFLIGDLKNGRDGSTGECIPKFNKPKLPDTTWDQIAMMTKDALLDYVKKSPQLEKT